MNQGLALCVCDHLKDLGLNIFTMKRMEDTKIGIDLTTGMPALSMHHNPVVPAWFWDQCQDFASPPWSEYP